jgi:putative oxidoreductase
MGDDFGKLVIRLTLGILFLLHGVAKIKGGVAGMVPMVTGAGLPAWMVYGAYAGEVLGPVLVILGLFTRTGAFLIFANMIFAVWLVHMGDLLKIGPQGGWALELQGMFLFTAFALMFMNPGRYAITRRF